LYPVSKQSESNEVNITFMYENSLEYDGHYLQDNI
jgi:hypothetical protein